MELDRLSAQPRVHLPRTRADGDDVRPQPRSRLVGSRNRSLRITARVSRASGHIDFASKSFLCTQES
eukprot:2487075-Pleurochrysis_carterae.AAC.1